MKLDRLSLVETSYDSSLREFTIYGWATESDIEYQNIVEKIKESLTTEEYELFTRFSTSNVEIEKHPRLRVLMRLVRKDSAEDKLTDFVDLKSRNISKHLELNMKGRDVIYLPSSLGDEFGNQRKVFVDLGSDVVEVTWSCLVNTDAYCIEQLMPFIWSIERI